MREASSACYRSARRPDRRSPNRADSGEPEIHARARFDQREDLGIRLGAREIGIEVRGPVRGPASRACARSLRTAVPPSAPAFPDPRREISNMVQPVVVAFDDAGGQRAAFTQGRNVSSDTDRSQGAHGGLCTKRRPSAMGDQHRVMAEHGRSRDRAKVEMRAQNSRHPACPDILSEAFARSRDRTMLCHRPITRSAIADNEVSNSETMACGPSRRLD